MIKAIYFFNRKTGISVEDFQDYWATTHADFVRQIPGLRGYVQCHTILSGYRLTTPPPFDGVEEVRFDSTAELTAMETTPAGMSAMADLSNFIDMERLELLSRHSRFPISNFNVLNHVFVNRTRFYNNLFSHYAFRKCSLYLLIRP